MNASKSCAARPACSTGAGDPSASVNLVRKHADSKDLDGYVNASAGSWDTWRATADVGGALTSDGRIRVRAVGRYEERRELHRPGAQPGSSCLYGVVDADMTDTTLLRAGIIYQDTKPKGADLGNSADLLQRRHRNPPGPLADRDC